LQLLSSNGHLKTLLKGFVLRHKLPVSTSSIAIITYFDILIMRLIRTTEKKWNGDNWCLCY